MSDPVPNDDAHYLLTDKQYGTSRTAQFGRYFNEPSWRMDDGSQLDSTQVERLYDKVKLPATTDDLRELREKAAMLDWFVEKCPRTSCRPGSGRAELLITYWQPAGSTAKAALLEAIRAAMAKEKGAQE